mgnify:CR=1 FL=1
MMSQYDKIVPISTLVGKTFDKVETGLYEFVIFENAEDH